MKSEKPPPIPKFVRSIGLAQALEEMTKATAALRERVASFKKRNDAFATFQRTGVSSLRWDSETR